MFTVLIGRSFRKTLSKKGEKSDFRTTRVVHLRTERDGVSEGWPHAGRNIMRGYVGNPAKTAAVVSELGARPGLSKHPRTVCSCACACVRIRVFLETSEGDQRGS